MPDTLRETGGLGCLALWLLALPRTLLTNSAGAYSHAALLAVAFVSAMGICAVLSVCLGQNGQSRKPTCTANANPDTASETTSDTTIGFENREAALVAAAGAVFSAACGLASLLATAPSIRVALACAQLAAGAPLVLVWARPLAQLAKRSERDMLATVCLAFGGAAAAHVLLDAAGILTEASANLLEWTGILLAFFSLLPLASWFSGRPLFAAATEPRKANDAETSSASAPDEGAAAPERHAQPTALLATAAFTSLVVSLFDGFTFAAHQFNLVHAALLEHALLLASMALVLFLTLRDTEDAKGAAAEGNALNLLGIPSFFLVIAGMVALNVGIPLSAAVSHGILQAAADCLLALSMAALASCAPAGVRPGMPFGAWWCLGLLAAGTVYGSCCGVALRRALGMDAAALTATATVCVAMFAILYFTQVGLSFGRKSPIGAGEAGDRNPADDVDAETAREIVAQSTREVLHEQGLSPREAEVVTLMLEGYDAATIAERLDIKLGTVRYHLTNAYRKAGVVSKTEMVTFVKIKLSSHENNS